jgi:hypothetical protein
MVSFGEELTIKTMITLRQQHEELDSEINKQYRDLVDKVVSVQYYDAMENEEDDDLLDCDCITYTTRNGDDVYAKVLGINKTDGIYVAKDEYDSERLWISLNDLSSLYDKITIVELLEATFELT